MNSNKTSGANYRHSIHCRMYHEAAALERLCQVVRIRGFRIEQMVVTTGDHYLDVAITLAGTRPVAMLQAQLEKLHTVIEAVLDTPAAASQTA